MKWPLLFFALYILILSCIPCFCNVMEGAVRSEQQAISPSHHHNDHEEENCNPFCACSCCPGATFYYQRYFSMAKPELQSIVTSFAITDQSFTSYNSHTIWQPPRYS
jgi:hypothetical protein